MFCLQCFVNVTCLPNFEILLSEDLFVDNMQIFVLHFQSNSFPNDLDLSRWLKYYGSESVRNEFD